MDRWTTLDVDEYPDFKVGSILELNMFEKEKCVGQSIWLMKDVIEYPFCMGKILGSSNDRYYWYYASDAAPESSPWHNMERAPPRVWIHFCEDQDCMVEPRNPELDEHLHVKSFRVLSNATCRSLLKQWGYAAPGQMVFDKATKNNHALKDQYAELATKLLADNPEGEVALAGLEQRGPGTKKKKKKGIASKGLVSYGPEKAPAEEHEAADKRRQKRPEEREMGSKERPAGNRADAVIDAELAKLRDAMGSGVTAAELADAESPDDGPSAKSAGKGSRKVKVPVQFKKPEAAQVLAERAATQASKRKAIALTEDAEPGTGSVAGLISLLRKASKSSLDNDDSDVELPGDAVEQKRMVYRRLAKQKPGVLLMRALKLMREQVTSLTGEDDADELSPICVRFFLSVFLPNYRHLNESVLREVRTLCEALDGLLRGRTMEIGDLLAMRLKAVMLAAQEGSWSVAKHLELLPPLQKNLPISQDEEMLLRKVQAGEMKIEELIAKIKKGQTSEPDKDRF